MHGMAEPYPWTTDEDELDEEAIIVSIGGTSVEMLLMGLSYVEPRADIAWFTRVTDRGFFEAGSEIGMMVPEALALAEQLRERMGYSRVVVTLQERGMWRPEWGRLATREGL